jgi:FAD synthase
MLLPQTFTGTIVHGFGRGHRTLGFPTANLNPSAWTIDTTEDAYGVYAGVVYIPKESPRIGVISLGKNLTFGVKTPTFEVHILDFDADIYGVEMRVDVQLRVRSMMPFTSIDQLKTQIAKDISDARKGVKLPAADGQAAVGANRIA